MFDQKARVAHPLREPRISDWSGTDSSITPEQNRTAGRNDATGTPGPLTTTRSLLSPPRRWANRLGAHA